MTRSLFPLVVFLALLAALGRVASAQDATIYPRINATASYHVDPDWPKKPANVAWSDMPGVAVDKKDQVWVFTRTDPPVQVYDGATGRLVDSWGTGELKKAHHLKIDHEGNIWVADIGRHVVAQYTPEGKRLRVLGTLDASGEDETHMNLPTDMAISPTGEVFVADGYGNNRVVHFDKNGKFVKTWGKLGTKPGEFSLPHAVALDSKGRVYIADRNNVRVQVFEQSGKFIEEWANIMIPWGFCVTKNDDIWVCGSSPMLWEDAPKTEPLGCPPKDQLFARFNTSGKLAQLWTVPKGEDGKEKPGELNWLHAIALDSKGNIYAGDIKGKRVQKFVRRESQAR